MLWFLCTYEISDWEMRIRKREGREGPKLLLTKESWDHLREDEGETKKGRQILLSV